MDLRGQLVALFRAVVEALSAERLVREACASGAAPRPAPGGRLVTLGLGKAAPEMLAGARASLGNALEALAFAVPAGAGGGVLIEGGHPLPDEGSLRAGEALLSAAASLRAEDAALLLVSGGGSALAEAPRPPLTLEDVRAMNDALVRSGAPIEEMNCVRAHLSRLKGGGLARALHAAGMRRARALVLVDVPQGGAPAVSGGPLAADRTPFADARERVAAGAWASSPPAPMGATAPPRPPARPWTVPPGTRPSDGGSIPPTRWPVSTPLPACRRSAPRFPPSAPARTPASFTSSSPHDPPLRSRYLLAPAPGAPLHRPPLCLRRWLRRSRPPRRHPRGPGGRRRRVAPVDGARHRGR